MEAGAGKRGAVGGDKQPAALVVGGLHRYELDLARPLSQAVRQSGGHGGKRVGGAGSGRSSGAAGRRGGRCRGAVQGAAAGTGASALVRRRRRRLRSVVDEGAGGRAGTAAAVLGRGRNAASRRAAVAGGQVCRHGSLVVGSSFPLDEGDGVGGAGWQAVAQPVAIVVAYQARLAVDHGDGALVACVDAQAAAGALVLVDVNNLAEHGTSFASCRISGSIIAGQRESARASMEMMESCGRTPTRSAVPPPSRPWCAGCRCAPGGCRPSGSPRCGCPDRRGSWSRRVRRP